MNAHLNVFKTYTKKERTHQLENDLTRALAICLQEDPLFFHEILKLIFEDSKYPQRKQIQKFHTIFSISYSYNRA